MSSRCETEDGEDAASGALWDGPARPCYQAAILTRHNPPCLLTCGYIGRKSLPRSKAAGSGMIVCVRGRVAAYVHARYHW